jgi:hypothetical protein
VQSALAETTYAPEECLTQQMMSEFNPVVSSLNNELAALQLL